MGKASETTEITVDLSAWRMKDITRWTTATMGAMDVPTLNELMANGAITSWPYEASPHDSASYDELTVQQWANAVGAVNKTARAIFQAAFGEN